MTKERKKNILNILGMQDDTFKNIFGFDLIDLKEEDKYIAMGFKYLLRDRYGDNLNNI